MSIFTILDYSISSYHHTGVTVTPPPPTIGVITSKGSISSLGAGSVAALNAVRNYTLAFQTSTQF